MVSSISWVLKVAEVKITNAIHNEAIDKINKNHNKYLFIYILNSSYINPNNDIAIITREQIYNMLPKIIKVNISFGHPKWIKIEPINIGARDEIRSFIWLKIFLFIHFLKFCWATLTIYVGQSICLIFRKDRKN